MLTLEKWKTGNVKCNIDASLEKSTRIMWNVT